MIFSGLNNEQYTTSRELGKGGEGVVFELSSHSTLVLKLYIEPLTNDKISKLKHMLAMNNDDIDAYAAWPVDLVKGSKGEVVGFVMRKLSGYVPLHMIFSPMDRKKLFPDKGYNFLVHIARNLATAFYKLHDAGLVIGDVNEGNILINSSGLVAFIDCDSFQVNANGKYYLCDVGVPRYTPPELLKERSFEKVIRTTNTDGFSMAVLIFQLLFLGRHPFAGKNKIAGDFDEETAIRKREFAYSLENPRKKLFPPNDSFAITNLSDELITLFHKAFEQDARPEDREWVTVLDSQLKDMASCHISRLHSFPSKMTECPWCNYQTNRGILYFLDDSYLQATAALGDVEGFVNGFTLEKPDLKKWTEPMINKGLAPAPIDRKYYQYRNYKWGSIGSLVTYAILAFTLHLNVFSAIVAVFASVLIYIYAPWSQRLNDELKRRESYQKQLHNGYGKLIVEYENPAEYVTYTKGAELMNKYVQDYRRLPQELERRRKLSEEKLYNGDLHEFLKLFDIETADISTFGTSKKASLISSGIYNAADISRLNTIKVPGIGPKNLQVLFSWQRQLAGGFVYTPDHTKLAVLQTEVAAEVDKIKSKLESLIRKEYQSLNYIRLNMTNKTNIMQQQLNDLALKVHLAHLETEAFRKLAA